MNLIKCRTCGDEFDPRTKKKIRGGYINQCIYCSQKDRDQMYLGKQGLTNKDASIVIFRTDLKNTFHALSRECNMGLKPSLGLQSVQAVQIFLARIDDDPGMNIKKVKKRRF